MGIRMGVYVENFHFRVRRAAVRQVSLSSIAKFENCESGGFLYKACEFQLTILVDEMLVTQSSDVAFKNVRRIIC